MHKAFQVLQRYAAAQNVSPTQDSCMIYMLSKKGDLYHLSFPITAEREQILPMLIGIVPEQDRAMDAMLCFLSWGVEIPTYAFRMALLQLDDANRQAIVFMNGENGLIEKPLAVTMPPSSV